MPGGVIGRSAGAWRQTNASRYVRKFQSRRSLLVWKIFGRRLDGWANTDHPTETAPGDAATLPRGANPRDADVDYTGAMMPPPDSGVPPLTGEEKLTIVRWIDLGAPIDLGRENGRPGYGWFLDETRPTLTISSPRPNRNDQPITEIRIGIADAYTGVNGRSLSVTADVSVAGRRPGTELAGLGRFLGDGIFSIAVTPPLAAAGEAHITATIRDGQGNLTATTVRFTVADGRVEAARRGDGSVASPPR